MLLVVKLTSTFLIYLYRLKDIEIYYPKKSAHCNCIYNFQGRENLDGRTKESVEVDFQQKWSPSVVGAFSLDFPESIKVFVYTLWNLLFPVDQVFARK